MRYLLIALVFLTFQACSTHLPKPKEVPTSYEEIYRDNKREGLKVYREEKKEWDIVLDPIETVPVSEYSFFEASQVKNWGEQLLLPASMRAELVAKWKYPVFVKVFDTGGKLLHPDLQTGQVEGRNYTTSPGFEDIQGHSTHVTGIIAGKDFGMLWDLVKAGKVKFQAIKILSDSGSGSFTWIANAFQAEEANNDLLRSQGWKVVVNGSFGGGTQIIPTIEKHLQVGVGKGTHFVFAAGNSGREVNYPGNSPFAITASSLDQNMKISSFSSRGPEVDHANPGGQIRSTYKNGYADLSGTSMASPFLASIVAIAQGLYGDQLPTPGHTKAYLKMIATDLGDKGKDDLYGYGVHFVQHILANPPSGTPEPEPEPEPSPEPEPQPGAKGVTIVDDNSYLVRWTKPGAATAGITRIQEIDITVQAKTNEEGLYDTGKAFLDYYFKSGSLGFNNSQATGYDAIYYTGYFMEQLAERRGLTLKVNSITGIDEAGRAFTVRANFKDTQSIIADLFLNSK
jgi:hypothetical protein